MSEVPFYSTGYGRRFFESQLPDLCASLERIANALERPVAQEFLAEQVERLTKENTAIKSKIDQTVQLCDQTIELVDRLIKAAKGGR